jgi:hypothetical protein
MLANVNPDEIRISVEAARFDGKVTGWESSTSSASFHVHFTFMERWILGLQYIQ